MYMYMYIYTCIYIYTHMYIYIYIYVYMYFIMYVPIFFFSFQADSRTCSKHLAAYVDQNADNAAFFDDCVFDLCHGAGESAAEITAELLASNQAV